MYACTVLYVWHTHKNTRDMYIKQQEYDFKQHIKRLHFLYFHSFFFCHQNLPFSVFSSFLSNFIVSKWEPILTSVTQNSNLIPSYYYSFPPYFKLFILWSKTLEGFLKLCKVSLVYQLSNFYIVKYCEAPQNSINKIVDCDFSSLMIIFLAIEDIINAQPISL